MEKQEKKPSTKKILIVCALEKELAVAKSYFKNQKPEGIQADFLCCGIGNLSTMLRLTEKLSLDSYDFVLNYGVCGYKNEKQDIIQIARSVYSPTMKELLIPVFLEFAPLKSILCSETAITRKDDLKNEEYVDMESFAIEKVCEHFRVPRLILKVPVDKVGEETQNFDTHTAKKLLVQHLDFEKIFQKTSKYIEKLPKNISLEKYENYFGFTVSEKIIFEKYYSKYTSLSPIDFEDFFEKFKKLRKKEFLKKLEEKNKKLSEI